MGLNHWRIELNEYLLMVGLQASISQEFHEAERSDQRSACMHSEKRVDIYSSYLTGIVCKKNK